MTEKITIEPIEDLGPRSCPDCGLSLIFLQELRGDTEGYCYGCYLKRMAKTIEGLPRYRANKIKKKEKRI